MARVIYLDDRTRRFARSLREAFPMDDAPCAIGISGPVVIPLGSPPLWARLVRACVRGMDRLLFNHWTHS